MFEVQKSPSNPKISKLSNPAQTDPSQISNPNGFGFGPYCEHKH